MSSPHDARWGEWPSRSRPDLLVMAMAPSASTLRRLNVIRICRQRYSTRRPRFVERTTSTTTTSIKIPHEPLKISSGALELAKWTALLFMTGDHINKYLFYETLPYLFEAGRIAMPLFILVLAYNLARPGSSTNGSYSRTSFRLGLFGALSSVPFIALGYLINGWYPLNILFTMLVITTVVRLIDAARSGSILAGLGAVIAFLVGGALVEFWWPAVTIGIGAWVYFRSGNLLGLLSSMVACASLWYINGNFWALAAYPLLFTLSRTDIKTPRLKWFFYAYYPAHLLAIFLVRIPMSKAGYEFF